MISFNQIYTGLFWMVIVNGLATAILLLILTKYPKYVVHMFNRFMCLKLGLSVKRLRLSPTMSVSYIERGRASPSNQTLLLVHGFSSSKFSYLGLIEHLPRRYHIVSLDLPGHGNTDLKEKDECHITEMVNYIKQFVDQLGLPRRKFHLLGASLGGHLCGVYASMFPNDLLSLALYCPSGIEFQQEKDMIEESLRTGTFILLPQNDAEFCEMVDFLTHKKLKIPSVIVSGIQQLRMEKNSFYRKLLETLILPENIHKLEESLHKVLAPVLLVWGKEDKILDITCVETIKRKLPVEPQKVVILDQVGHSILLERPKKSAYILIDFLNTIV